MSSLSPFQGEITSESISSGAISVSSGNIGATVSGGITISGGVTVSGMVGISGNVAVISGAISVVSGSITINSGQVVVSGLFNAVSGVYLSGAGGVAGAIPVVPLAFDFSGAKWNQMSVLASGQNMLSVGTRPSTVIRVGLSGVMLIPTSGVPSLSGGVALSSGDCNQVTIRNLGVSGMAGGIASGGILYIGSSTERPFSGFGFPLAPGDGLTLSIQNFNQIYCFMSVSGGLISYIGTQF